MNDMGINIRIPKDKKKSTIFVLWCGTFVFAVASLVTIIVCIFSEIGSPFLLIPLGAIDVFLIIASYINITEIWRKWQIAVHKAERDKKAAREEQERAEHREYILKHNLDLCNIDDGECEAVYVDGKFISPEEAYKKEVADALNDLISTLDNYTDISDAIGHITAYPDSVIDAIGLIKAEIVRAVDDSSKEHDEFADAAAYAYKVVQPVSKSEDTCDVVDEINDEILKASGVPAFKFKMGKIYDNRTGERASALDISKEALVFGNTLIEIDDSTDTKVNDDVNFGTTQKIDANEIAGRVASINKKKKKKGKKK